MALELQIREALRSRPLQTSELVKKLGCAPSELKMINWPRLDFHRWGGHKLRMFTELVWYNPEDERGLGLEIGRHVPQTAPESYYYVLTRILNEHTSAHVCAIVKLHYQKLYQNDYSMKVLLGYNIYETLERNGYLKPKKEFDWTDPKGKDLIDKVKKTINPMGCS